MNVPAVIRSDPEFSGAVGTGVRLNATITPASVEAGQAATLSLRISGVQNPDGVNRPALDSLPAFSQSFQVEAGEQAAGTREVTFLYRLKPRTVGTMAVPRVRLRYFNPAAAEGRQLQTAYSEALVLTVAPSSAVVPSTVTRELPERFREPITISTPWIILHPMLWLVVIPITAVLIPTVVSMRRSIRSRRASQSQSVAARLALKQIQAARTSNDPARIVAQAVQDYLTAKPELDRSHANELFAACEEFRFSNIRNSPAELILQAERLLAAWEAKS
ncbi:MAG: BatD family protein [Gemmataceae bacterium]